MSKDPERDLHLVIFTKQVGGHTAARFALDNNWFIGEDASEAVKLLLHFKGLEEGPLRIEDFTVEPEPIPHVSVGTPIIIGPPSVKVVPMATGLPLPFGLKR